MTDITVRFAEKELLLKSKFAKKAAQCGTPESVKLQKYIQLYPSFDIVVHEIRKAPAQEHYKGLTYDYMRDYINAHESEENASAVLQELEDMIDISKCHSQGKRYPTIKEWFLVKYPAVKKFGVKEEDTEDTSAEMDPEVTPLKETA